MKKLKDIFTCKKCFCGWESFENWDGGYIKHMIKHIVLAHTKSKILFNIFY